MRRINWYVLSESFFQSPNCLVSQCAWKRPLTHLSLWDNVWVCNLYGLYNNIWHTCNHDTGFHKFEHKIWMVTFVNISCSLRIKIMLYIYRMVCVGTQFVIAFLVVKIKVCSSAYVFFLCVPLITETVLLES